GYAIKWATAGKIDLPEYSRQTKEMITEYENKKRGKSYASGLSYVPYNGFQATLHKGERVLTPEENKQYTRFGGGVQIAKLADQIIVREEADIDKIGEALVRKIYQAAQAGA